MTNFYKLYKRHQYTKVIPFLLMITDVFLIYAVFYVALTFGYLQSLMNITGPLTAHIFALTWILSYLINLGYFIENLSSIRKILRYFGIAFVIYNSIILFLFLSMSSDFTVLLTVVFLTVITSVVVLVIRLFCYAFYRFYKNLPSNQKNTILIGYNSRSRKLYKYFTNTDGLPNRVIGVFDDEEISDSSVLSLYYQGGLDQVMEFCLKNNVREIYFTLNTKNQQDYIDKLTDFVDKHYIYLGFISNADKIDLGENVEAKVFDNGKIPVISYRKLPLRFTSNALVKRAFDIAFSSVALFFLVPLVFLPIAIAIKMTSRGPVFFIQKRPGFNGTVFDCYKFRTMVVNNEGHRQTTRTDRRVTSIGKILRKTSLDELPQFINVLKGDMSVVGPRPNLIAQLEEYSPVIKDYEIRHSVVPGITGYAQISGYRGPTIVIEDMEKRVEHDLWYMENWSLRFDLQIIASSVVNMVKGERNAY